MCVFDHCKQNKQKLKPKMKTIFWAARKANKETEKCQNCKTLDKSSRKWQYFLDNSEVSSSRRDQWLKSDCRHPSYETIEIGT